MLIRREVVPDGFVTISDEEESINKALENNEAVIGILAPHTANRNWSGVTYLMEDCECLDDAFLMEVYSRHHNIPMTIGESNRLRIREMTEDDLEALYRFYEDEMTSLFLEKLDDDRETELEKLKAYIRNVYRFYGCGMWVVEDATKKHPTIIGRVGLEPESYRNQTEWFLGYLIDKRYRNRGLCMEACQLAISYAVDRLGLSNIYCRIDDSNTISHYIAKKLSFEPFEKEEGSTVYKKKI